MLRAQYVIDGQEFSTLEEFGKHFNKAVLTDYVWQSLLDGNLDAFNDVLYGGFGTPDEGFILVWKNSHISRERLGYTETETQLLKRLEKCHPSNRELVRKELDKARQQTGPTVFDWLVDIIRDHKNIDLRLE